MRFLIGGQASNNGKKETVPPQGTVSFDLGTHYTVYCAICKVELFRELSDNLNFVCIIIYILIFSVIFVYCRVYIDFFVYTNLIFCFAT